jgi:hypothetical protein
VCYWHSERASCRPLKSIYLVIVNGICDIKNSRDTTETMMFAVCLVLLFSSQSTVYLSNVCSSNCDTARTNYHYYYITTFSPPRPVARAAISPRASPHRAHHPPAASTHHPTAHQSCPNPIHTRIFFISQNTPKSAHDPPLQTPSTRKRSFHRPWAKTPASPPLHPIQPHSPTTRKVPRYCEVPFRGCGARCLTLDRHGSGT